jgi:hypothetical protein
MSYKEDEFPIEPIHIELDENELRDLDEIANAKLWQLPFILVKQWFTFRNEG